MRFEMLLFARLRGRVKRSVVIPSLFATAIKFLVAGIVREERRSECALLSSEVHAVANLRARVEPGRGVRTLSKIPSEYDSLLR